MAFQTHCIVLLEVWKCEKGGQRRWASVSFCCFICKKTKDHIRNCTMQTFGQHFNVRFLTLGVAVINNRLCSQSVAATCSAFLDCCADLQNCCCSRLGPQRPWRMSKGTRLCTSPVTMVCSSLQLWTHVFYLPFIFLPSTPSLFGLSFFFFRFRVATIIIEYGFM